MTRKNHLAHPKGWSKAKPSFHERTLMYKKCPKRCFLGTKKSYPICNRKTCKRSRKGISAVYMRAKAKHNYKVAKKAEKLLKK